MVGGKMDAKRKYPIWNIQVLGTMEQLEKATNSFLYGYRDMLQIGEGEDEGIDDSKSLPEHPPIQEDDLILKKIQNAKTKAELNDIFGKLGEEEQGKYITAIQDREQEIANPESGLFGKDEN